MGRLKAMVQRAEQRVLAERERYYRALLSHVADIIVVTDGGGLIRVVSPAVETVAGYRPEELVGLDAFRLFHPDDVAKGRSQSEQVQQGPAAALLGQFRVRHADGSWRHMEILTANLLQDPLVGGLLHTVRDVTARVETEAALRESEHRLRLMTEHSSDIITLYGADGATLYASPATLSILGYTPEYYAAAPPEELVHPHDLAKVLQLRERSQRGEPGSVTFRMRTDAGEYLWFETLTRPILDEQGQIRKVQASTRNVTERKRFEEQLAFVAYHDSLTGLPNRAACVERLTWLLACGGEGSALLFLDLDNFKLINDSLGHQAGDQLLIEAAGRLMTFAGSGGLAARLGGDEFVLLLEGVGGEGAVTNTVRELLATMGQPVALGQQQVFPGCSVGIVLVTPEHRTPEALLSDADLALHEAKGHGKAGFAVFAPAMRAAALERLQLEMDLRTALREGHLTLVYQPIVALPGGQPVSMEALVRWNHPERGLITPDRFIPLAEETGLILQIDRWVLEQACREACTWPERLGAAPTVSVNLSALHLRHPGLARVVSEVLAATGLAPGRLKLEITETALMSNAESTLVTLQELRALGVRLAIDDFGTGYSSLSYLRRFPVDSLKIDRSFVSDLGHRPEDTALVRMVISLAVNLRLRVTAEGVETAAQAQLLHQLGCHRAQGYLYSRPVPAAELEALMARRLRSTGAGSPANAAAAGAAAEPPHSAAGARAAAARAPRPRGQTGSSAPGSPQAPPLE